MEALEIKEGFITKLQRRRRLVVRCIPFTLLKVPPVWSPDRYADNLKLISETHSVPPIEVYYDTEIKMFTIHDGIHRANVVRDLGYECIPAAMFPKYAKKFDAMRLEAPPAPEPPVRPPDKTMKEQIMQMDYDHTLEELKRIARERGVSPSGTKHDIIKRLI